MVTIAHFTLNRVINYVMSHEAAQCSVLSTKLRHELSNAPRFSPARRLVDGFVRRKASGHSRHSRARQKNRVCLSLFSTLSHPARSVTESAIATRQVSLSIWFCLPMNWRQVIWIRSDVEILYISRLPPADCHNLLLLLLAIMIMRLWQGAFNFRLSAESVDHVPIALVLASFSV